MLIFLLPVLWLATLLLFVAVCRAAAHGDRVGPDAGRGDAAASRRVSGAPEQERLDSPRPCSWRVRSQRAPALQRARR